LKIKACLAKVWGGKDSMVTRRKGKMFKMTGNNEEKGLSFRNFSFRNLSIFIKDKLVKKPWYSHCVAVFIFACALLQMIDSTQGDNEVSAGFHWLFQIFFLLECGLVFFTHYDAPKEYLKEPWNIFDLVITILLFVPTVSPEEADYQFIEALRIFRLSRCLVTFSAVSIDLNIVLSAISSSALCLVYVFVLVLVFFFYSALIAVLMFRSADPDAFGNFGSALQALLQTMTLDNWDANMKDAMYGCSNRLFVAGLRYRDMTPLCETVSGNGVGWWAPIFFVVFIILASYVLSSLLVGVIITSMELLREGVNDEAAIWEKVAKVTKRYETDKATLDLLLELFEIVDVKKNAMLTFEEVEPIMNVLEMDETSQFEFYMKVDKDKSGQIDFSEFCEMIILM